jgi:hypothetical protein
MVEAEQRGLDLSVPKAEPKASKRAAAAEPPPRPPAPPVTEEKPPVAESNPPVPHTVPPTPEASGESATAEGEASEATGETESQGEAGQQDAGGEAAREARGEGRGDRGERRGDRRGDNRGGNRGEGRGDDRNEPPDDRPMPTDPEAIRGELAAISEESTKGRLAPRDEDRATAHLRSCIAAGDTAPALSAMPKLPWILGVRAIEQAWPTLSPEGRTALLASLTELPGEYAVRLRLSVARSLLRIEPAIGMELAGAVCQTMWDGEKGALSAEHSKLVGNVFIGRGKPWVLQLPLGNLGPAEADAVASCVVYSAFNVNNPPITQLSILRYAGDRLGGLHANLLGLVAKNINRWGGRWQTALRKEIPNLPEPLAVALKPAEQPRKPEPAPAQRREAAPERPPVEEEAEIPLPPELEEKLKLALESGDSDAVATVNLEANAWRSAQRHTVAANRDEDAEEGGDSSRGPRRGNRRDRERERERPRDRNDNRSDSRSDNRNEGKKERPAYVSREQEAKGTPIFNLGQSLRQIENYVQQLRNDLSTAQTRLRKNDTGRKSSTDRVVLSVEESNLSPEELKRLVVQLEQRNNDLAGRVEELLADSEARALATAADNDITEQYRTLIKLKLQEDYNDYLALEKNSPEYVVQQHYRALIRHVFAILRDEGIGLKGDLPPPPPPPMPPPPPPPIIEDEEDEEASALDALDATPESAEAAVDEDAGEEIPVDEAGTDSESSEEESAPAEDGEVRPPDDDEVPEEPRAAGETDEAPAEGEERR